jgi:hypothetical protein
MNTSSTGHHAPRLVSKEIVGRRTLSRAAFGGHGYDPDAYDTALLVHRAARAGAAARRAEEHPPALAA